MYNYRGIWSLERRVQPRHPSHDYGGSVNWSGKGKLHDRKQPRRGKSCELCGERQALSLLPHGTMPRMEIWRGVWLVDRPMRTKFRVKIGVSQRAIASNGCSKCQGSGARIMWVISRGLNEDFSVSKPRLESKQEQTLSASWLGTCFDGGERSIRHGPLHIER